MSECCPNCGGPTVVIDCSTCGTVGRVVVETEYGEESASCPTCSGGGGWLVCPTCDEAKETGDE